MPGGKVGSTQFRAECTASQTSPAPEPTPGTLRQPRAIARCSRCRRPAESRRLGDNHDHAGGGAVCLSAFFHCWLWPGRLRDAAHGTRLTSSEKPGRLDPRSGDDRLRRSRAAAGWRRTRSKVRSFFTVLPYLIGPRCPRLLWLLPFSRTAHHSVRPAAARYVRLPPSVSHVSLPPGDAPAMASMGDRPSKLQSDLVRRGCCWVMYSNFIPGGGWHAADVRRFRGPIPNRVGRLTKAIAPIRWRYGRRPYFRCWGIAAAIRPSATSTAWWGIAMIVTRAWPNAAMDRRRREDHPFRVGFSGFGVNAAGHSAHPSAERCRPASGAWRCWPVGSGINFAPDAGSDVSGAGAQTS